MTKLNKDGLVPGAAVSYEDMRAVQLTGKPASKKPMPKAAPVAKAEKAPEIQEPYSDGPVVIPDDWDSQPFMVKRALAHKIAGNKDANNGDEVKAVINAELESRKG